MYLSLLFITFLLVASSHTFPVDIQARQAHQCKVDKKQGPCICNDQFTIRNRKPGKICANTGFTYINPSLNVADGRVELRAISDEDITDCDHMVELGFIADQINQKGNEAICDKLVNKGTTTTTAIYTNLFDAINSQTNLVRVERDINQAKGAAMSNVLDAFSRSSKKTKLGVVNYLTEIKANTEYPSTNLALSAIAKVLEPIPGEFTQSFTNNYNKLMVDTIVLAQKAAAAAPAPAPPTASGAVTQKAPTPAPAPPTASGAATEKAPTPAPTKPAPPPAAKAAAPKAPAPAKPGR